MELDRYEIDGKNFILVAGVARKLASSGYAVFAMDYPGFGLSEGLHGYIPSLDKLVNDVADHFSKIKGKLSELSKWESIKRNNHLS